MKKICHSLSSNYHIENNDNNNFLFRITEEMATIMRIQIINYNINQKKDIFNDKDVNVSLESSSDETDECNADMFSELYAYVECLEELQYCEGQQLEIPNETLKKDKFDQNYNEMISIGNELKVRFDTLMNASDSVMPSEIARGWCILAYAKIQFVLYLDIQTSIHYTRSLLSSTNRLIEASVQGAGDVYENQHKVVDYEFLLLRFESLLLMIELYDHVGATDKVISYVAEAKSMTEKMEIEGHEEVSILPAILQLHCIRIWYRLGSSKWTTIDTANSCNNNNNYDSYVIKKTRSLIYCLKSFLLQSETSSNTVDSNFTFRRLNLCWDISTVGMARIHSYMPKYWRHKLLCYHRTPSDLADFQSKISCLNNNDYQANEDNFRRQAVPSFDILRLIRRVSAIDHCKIRYLSYGEKDGSDVVKNNDVGLARKMKDVQHSFLHSFALLSGSCHVSSEACLYSREADGMSSLEQVCTLVRRCCNGEDAALQNLQRQLSDISQNNNCTICSISLESIYTKQLIIGRYENEFGALVCTLGVSAELEEIITQWDESMEVNKKLLRQTSVFLPSENPSTSSSTTNDDRSMGVLKWSESEKKSWWQKRKQSDDEMKKMLHILQRHLGPWRCMLRANKRQHHHHPPNKEMEKAFRDVETTLANKIVEYCGTKQKNEPSHKI